MRTDGEVAEFVVRYEFAIADCDARRRELVGLIDKANTKPKKRLFGMRF
jgi:hypothetical protein